MKIHPHFAGHMHKMAAMPIYGKNTLKIFLPGTTGQILMKLCMKNQRPNSFIICANYYLWVDLDLFYGKVKFCNLGFYMGKCDNDGFFGNYCIL